MEEGIDVSKLDKEFETLKSKYTELDRYKVLFLGIIIGLVITIPVQIAIMPLNYDGNILKYGDIPISEVDEGLYIEICIGGFLFSLIIIVMLIRMKIFGIVPLRTVELKYYGNYKNIYEKLRDFLKKECEYLGLKIRTPSDKEIVCFVNGTYKDRRGFEVKVVFKPDLDVVILSYNITSEYSPILLRKIKQFYQQ